MTCPTDLRLWCAPSLTGLPGISVEELAVLITPFLPATGGKVAQIVTATDATYQSTMASIPSDDTIPQQTEGFEALTAAITPNNAGSTLIIDASIFLLQTPGNKTVTSALFRDATANALAATQHSSTEAGLWSFQHTVKAVIPATAAVATTFKLRVGNSDGSNLYINGDNVSRMYGGVAKTTLQIMEVLP